MPSTGELSVALKEWDVVCRALESGRQMILLRKGGILEAIGGFELEHPQFLLFPTFLHQNLQMLKPQAHGGFETASAEPETVTLRAAAEVSDIVQLKDRAQMDRLDAEHIWTPPLIDMRFNYRPKNPLYLLLLRVWRLATPVTIDNTPEYAGCKSWVPLQRPISTAGATPVMDHAAFDRRRQQIIEQLAQG
jgi:hypothetical protein